jgi:hypothetical protein
MFCLPVIWSVRYAIESLGRPMHTRPPCTPARDPCFSSPVQIQKTLASSPSWCSPSAWCSRPRPRPTTPCYSGSRWRPPTRRLTPSSPSTSPPRCRSGTPTCTGPSSTANDTGSFGVEMRLDTVLQHKGRSHPTFTPPRVVATADLANGPRPIDPPLPLGAARHR